MKPLAQAVSAALCSFALATSAQAASYIVQANGALNAPMTKRLEAAGGRISALLPQIRVAIVESDAADFSARAAGIAGVRSVAQDFEVQFDVPEMLEVGSEDYANPPNAVGADTFFNLQWGHAAVDAAGAWNRGYEGAGATVAVLDTGVRCNHPDIAANLLLAQSTSFVKNEAVCNTSGGNHGTHVAGTILGVRNNIGITGIAPQAKLIAVKVLSARTGGGSFAGIIQGIVHATDAGADVINMSLGVGGGLPIGGNEVAELVNATARAVRYARHQGALVVVAAGNDGMDLDHSSHVEICDEGVCDSYNLRSFPAELPGTVTVSATAPTGWAKNPVGTDLDGVASYTNYGRSAIDLSAPGGDAAYPGNENCSKVVVRPCWVFDMVFSSTTGGWGWSAGTSMAAPHVAGVAALVYGKHPGIKPAQVEAILQQSADHPGSAGQDAYYGHGRVNAAAAVAQ